MIDDIGEGAGAGAPRSWALVRTAGRHVDIYDFVARWFAHSMQPNICTLPPNTRFATELPFEVISPLGEGQHIIDSGRPRQRTFCEETLNSNRLTKIIDPLVAWNGRLQYECVFHVIVNAVSTGW